MELTQQEIWDIFLNQIMEENNVSIKSVYECMKTNEDEINAMDTLFDYDDDLSIRKRLVLLHLISQDRVKENMDYYRNNVENSGEASLDPDIEKYKTLLIASLIFNLDFFIMVCNWCGFIQADVRKIKQKNKERDEDIKSRLVFKTKITDIEEENTQMEYKVEEVKDTFISITIISIIEIIKHNHATPATDDDNDVFEEIFTKTITYKDISGTLVLMGDKQNRIYLEFRFDKCKKEIKEIPFELEFRFKTINGPKDNEYSLVANIPRKDKTRKIITTIYSDIYSNEKGDIDFSSGIEANSKVLLKLMPN